MCGRFDRHSSLTQFAKVIEDLCVEASDDLPPSYNVAPSQCALVVSDTHGGRVALACSWGFTPSWVTNPKMKRPINARLETVDKRPMFCGAFRARRCLVLCDGYYEWQVRSTGAKQPYYFHQPEGVPFALAGIWERNERLPGTSLKTFCVLTRAASTGIEHIHHRMPLLLSRTEYAAWLDPSVHDIDILRRLTTSSRDDWVFYPVSRFVNSPENNSSRCRESLGVGEAL